MERVAAVLLACICMLAARSAHADPAADAEACIDAHVSAQRLMRDARLTEARRKLVECARAGCPQLVVGECSQWLREVSDRMPSIVIAARNSDGEDVTAVRAYVDGKPLTERLDGRQLEVDPGPHVFRFELAGAPAVEKRAVVRERERGRVLDVTFVTRGESNRTSTAVYVFGAVGAASLVTFSVFATIGLSQKSDLEDCKPNCSDADVNRVRRSFVIADTALGTGIITFSIAAVLYFTESQNAPQRASARAGRGPAFVDGAFGYRF